MRTRANLIGSTALAAALMFPSAILAGMGATEGENLGAGLTVQQKNGISYVSGGVGDDQQNALKSTGDRFNLKVTLATRGGKYLGGADIRIIDGQGEEILATRSDGPLFLAKLPPGNYTVHANAEGKSLSQKVDLSAKSQQQVVMSWPEIEAGDEPIQAGDAPLR